MTEDRHIAVLKIGLGITFIWIGYFILQDPAGWAGFIKPWAKDLLILDPIDVMKFNAVYDILVGALLIVAYKRWMIWLGGLLAALHMIAVLVTAGVDPITVRDIAVLSGALSLCVWAWPSNFNVKKSSNV